MHNLITLEAGRAQSEKVDPKQASHRTTHATREALARRSKAVTAMQATPDNLIGWWSFEEG